MSSAKRINLTSATVLAISSWTHAAIAQDLATSSPVLAATVGWSLTASQCVAPTSDTPVADTSRSLFASSPLTAAALASQRGGDRVFNDNQLKGVVADNHASNLTTGANVISDGAFSGAVGLPTVIQNSGNNVLIQNATIVNVQVR
jgi:hypothetical protein